MEDKTTKKTKAILLHVSAAMDKFLCRRAKEIGEGKSAYIRGLIRGEFERQRLKR